MTSYTFDSNIIIDALAGYGPAREEIRRAVRLHTQVWVSRMVCIEVMSKGGDEALARAQVLLSGFGVDELDGDIAARAAALRRDRPRLKSPDAIILASAQLHGRILISRNIKDFPANMPGVRVPYIL